MVHTNGSHSNHRNMYRPVYLTFPSPVEGRVMGE
jgi:hypothetical protein